ncbi:hypothetical protein EJB05_52283, partial [Eragrostis curvula]
MLPARQPQPTRPSHSRLDDHDVGSSPGRKPNSFEGQIELGRAHGPISRAHRFLPLGVCRQRLRRGPPPFSPFPSTPTAAPPETSLLRERGSTERASTEASRLAIATATPPPVLHCSPAPAYLLLGNLLLALGEARIHTASSIPGHVQQLCRC